MLCRKASQKLTAISRLSNLMSKEKRIVLIRTFFESQFNYCPLIWMFCSRTLNHKINKLHERALRIAYKDYKSSFYDLLEKDCTVTIHQRNLRSLATEMYKISHNLCPTFMNEMITEASLTYNTRSTTKVEIDHNGVCESDKKLNYKVPAIKTVSFGYESFRYLGPKIWSLVPDDMKHVHSLQLFKKKVKSLKFENCPCNLCKTYIQSVGYID